MKRWIDPSNMQRLSEAFQRREALLARAESLTDDEVRRGVEEILSGDQNTRNMWALAFAKVGKRAEPSLLAALDDPRAAPPATKIEYPAPGWNDRPRIEAIFDALAAIGSDAVIPRAVPLLRSEQEGLRCLAARTIGAVGSEAAAESTVAALRDAERSVRSSAHIGIGRALEAWRISAGFRRAVVAALEPIAAGQTDFNDFMDRQCCTHLLALDRDRAAQHLTSPQCIRLDNPHLIFVLPALSEAGVVADAAALREIHAAASQRPEHPWPRVAAVALEALALADPQAAGPLVEAALESPDEAVWRGGAEALLRLHGLPDPHALWGLDAQWDDLPKPVRHVIASVAFEAEVNNGGLDQYFINNAGDHWPTAIEALREMNCLVCVEILEQAVAQFGRSGPSLDRDKRIDQVRRLSDASEKILDALNTRFYEGEDRIQVRRARYMAKHAEAIRRVEVPPPPPLR